MPCRMNKKKQQTSGIRFFSCWRYSEGFGCFVQKNYQFGGKNLQSSQNLLTDKVLSTIITMPCRTKKKKLLVSDFFSCWRHFEGFGCFVQKITDLGKKNLQSSQRVRGKKIQ